MKRLIEIGFQRVGEWVNTSEGIRHHLSSFQESENVLYAFALVGSVVYVGKTTKTLQQRMNQYQSPGPTQRTNIRINQEIARVTSPNAPIEIYAFPDNGLHHYGPFHVNLAAGLEDSIIRTIGPKWNAM